MAHFSFKENTDISIDEFVRAHLPFRSTCFVSQGAVKIIRDASQGISTIGLSLGEMGPLLVSHIVNSLSCFLHSGDAKLVFDDLLEYTDEIEDENLKQYIYHLVTQVKGEDYVSLISLVQLTCWQLDAWAYRDARKTRMLLPSEKGCNVLLAMAKQVNATTERYGAVPCDYPHFEKGYNANIGYGIPDYISDTALWMVRVENHRPDVYIWYYLLSAYMVAKATGKHTGLRHLRCINPKLGVIYEIDVCRIDPVIFNQLKDAYLAPTQPA